MFFPHSLVSLSGFYSNLYYVYNCFVQFCRLVTTQSLDFTRHLQSVFVNVSFLFSLLRQTFIVISKRNASLLFVLFF